MVCRSSSRHSTISTSSPSAWWCADCCLRGRMQIFILLTPFFVPPSYPPPPRDPYPDPRRIHQRLRGASPWRHANLHQDRDHRPQLCISVMVCRSSSRHSTPARHLLGGVQIFVSAAECKSSSF